MRKRLMGVAGVGAITATVTLLALQPVSFGRGAPAVFLVVVGVWLFVRGGFLAGAALFTAAEEDDQKWRLWLIPLQVVLGFGALYAAVWRLDAGSLVGAGLEPELIRFSVFSATLGAAGGIAPEDPIAYVALAAEVLVIAIVVGALLRRLNRRTGWVVGGIVVVLATGLALALGQERRLPSDFQRGMTLTGYDRDAYARPEAGEALRATVDLGVEWVTIVPAWYQEDASADTVAPSGERTPSAKSVERIIDQARDLHLDVTLKPHLNLLHGGFRGEIEPEHPDRWFRSYERMIDFYADLGERAGVKQLVVGTELEGVSGDEERWRRLIRHVRGRFSGRLTYAANYDEARRVRFWDALDLVGVDAYYPLTKEAEPDVSALVEAWRRPVGRLERLHERWGRDVLLTEIGYPAAESAARTPFEGRGAQDLDLQKRAVEAALTAVAERPWIAGMYWWEWTTQPSGVEPDDTGLTLNDRPAADVIEEWYSD